MERPKNLTFNDKEASQKDWPYHGRLSLFSINFVSRTQTAQTIIGSKASRARDPDGALENDGEIGERDQGRTSTATNQDVSSVNDKFSNLQLLSSSSIKFSNLPLYRQWQEKAFGLRHKREESTKTVPIVAEIGIQRKRGISGC